ncbi:MAG TPA: PRC-barrel domain-containing protein [Candidatus Angelobacter sp.]|nr:PRC-barrel domain-containing protein [Candidatus Angelobacter sp.]
MTKTGLKITVVWAACAMLSATAWAQADSANSSSQNQNQRSWSTKRLTATGRTEDGVARGSQLIGAQVSDSSGQRVGQIQDTVINPNTGRIDFALVLLEQNPSATGAAAAQSANDHLVPVPWSLLRNSAASSQYANKSERLSFTVNTDAAKLKGAPVVDWSHMNESQWRQRIYAYYGVTPHASMGGAESPQGENSGQGSRGMQPSNPETEHTPNH